MIFDLLTPPQGPRGRGQKQIAVACPIYVSNSHTKFGWISSNGSGGDSITDRRMEAITISPSLFQKSVGIITTAIYNEMLSGITYADMHANVWGNLHSIVERNKHLQMILPSLHYFAIVWWPSNRRFLRISDIYNLNLNHYIHKVLTSMLLHTRGIWKVFSMVFYLSNRFTNPVMFGFIWKNYLSPIIWHNFHKDIILQTRKISLWIHVLFIYWKTQNFSGKYNILPFKKYAEH